MPELEATLNQLLLDKACNLKAITSVLKFSIPRDRHTRPQTGVFHTPVVPCEIVLDRDVRLFGDRRYPPQRRKEPAFFGPLGILGEDKARIAVPAILGTHRPFIAPEFS